jgi:hypothetical protein
MTIQSQTLTEEEIAQVKANCPSLRENLPPTPELLACLQRWRQEDARTTKEDDDASA